MPGQRAARVPPFDCIVVTLFRLTDAAAALMDSVCRHCVSSSRPSHGGLALLRKPPWPGVTRWPSWLFLSFLAAVPVGSSTLARGGAGKKRMRLAEPAAGARHQHLQTAGRGGHSPVGGDRYRLVLVTGLDDHGCASSAC